MKFSTMTVVLVAALCMAGCKYDKAASGGVPDAGEANTKDLVTRGVDENATEGTLADLAEAKFDELYAKCTDVDFAAVYFGFDSTVIPQGELGKVDLVVEHLKARPERVVLVEGNCDERGSNEYNMTLGENRAIIVRNYLVQNGIAENRIQTRSYGEERPAAEGHDESAWALNRRAEFGIYDKTQKK